MEFAELKGKTFSKVERIDDEIFFYEVKSGGLWKGEGRTWRLYHDQECCESVGIEDINGDLGDLENSPILVAEEVTSEDNPAGIDYPSGLWTFYKLATIKGSVTIRWWGQDNYYSVSVDFEEVATVAV